MERRSFIRGLLVAGFCPACARVARAAERASWSYEGPDGPAHWSALDEVNTACSAGSQQSPINIVDAVMAHLPPIEINWRAGGAMVNNGHTIQVNVPGGSRLTRGDKSYDLLQYHFHAPSEHLVDGRGFAMEVHFVHKDPESGALGVLGIFLEPGEVNGTFASLAAAFPDEGGAEVSAEGVDPNLLLPDDLAYWTYQGSLTTPPCTEIVNWMVVRAPLEVAATDMEKFTALYPMNARPLLSANRRFILASG